MPKPAPGSPGVRSFWGCAQDLMMAATEEWKMEATVLYRQEPGKAKAVTAVLTETSKFRELDAAARVALDALGSQT